MPLSEQTRKITQHAKTKAAEKRALANSARLEPSERLACLTLRKDKASIRHLRIVGGNDVN